MNLTKNTILITGGTSGIGFELTKQLLKLGNKVIITGRDINKLKKAKELLENGPMPINEICHAIGFESVFSFSALFKNRFGMAPSYFRKGE